jgi:DNA polymerase
MDETKIKNQIRECRSCNLGDRCRGPVPWDGPSGDICVVGEAPGREEDEIGRPFVGPSGRLARSWIEPRFGEVAWLNTVSCFPNRTPTRQEIDACHGNLMKQLEVIGPRLVLLFGGIAVSAFVDHRVGEIRGRWIRIGHGHSSMVVYGMATWHPAAVLRNRSLEIDVLDDLRVFRESVGDDAIPPYVYRPCIKCGSLVDTHITEQGIAWCGKHWAWKIGTAGRGRSSKKGRPNKLTLSF